MIMRQDYISGKATHDQYYSQFVTDEVKKSVLYTFSLRELKEAFKKDEHLNTLSLKIWDNMSIPSSVVSSLKEAGDGYSLAGKVCILKQAARSILKEARD